MRERIWSVNHKTKVFYLIIDGKKTGFYLSNRLNKTFMAYLQPGVLVDFAVFDQMKKVDHAWVYQVAYFNQIIQINPYRVHYDLEQLRAEMKDVLEKKKYFLFIDFEMTMPGYKERDFQSEIIQVGYVLSEAGKLPILEDGYYVLPKHRTYLSRRTIKFLKLDSDLFFSTAKHYDHFYQAIKDIVETYQPKLVVWGKNDYQALNDSYQLHQMPKLLQSDDFIDLLKLHKDYYNLKDDLGLFKAYKTYYKIEEAQAHDAIADARVTKMVFDAFLEKM
jgi:sporulation inhibitor KapD